MARAAPSRISVLLPCRDAAATLPAALESLAAQSHEDLEIIAVDDGSTDGTFDLLLDRAARDRRVRPMRSRGRGLVRALGTALAAARGQLVARMDADDIADPRRLELQAALLAAEPRVAACGTHVRYFPRERLGTGARRYEAWLGSMDSPESVEREIFVECPIAHPTLLARRSALHAVGGYRDMGWPEDYDLVLRLWAAGHRLGVVPEVLLAWREGGARLSRTSPLYAPAAFRRCKVEFMRRTLLQGRDGVVVWGAGSVGKPFARELAAHGVAIRAFVDLDPRKIGQEIHGAPVVAPGHIDAYRGAFCVAAVGTPGARGDIRAALDAAGWREMADWCAVA